ncbi:MAG: hypothetical protein HYT77_10805 [Deltaproteobacteria bacterium]|nr:hypothetical protein [Deltaproteobacteria bacterium]
MPEKITAESFVRGLMNEWGLKEKGARVCRELKGGLGEVFVYEGDLVYGDLVEPVSIRGEITHSHFLLRASRDRRGPLGGAVNHIVEASVSRRTGWTWLTKAVSEPGSPAVGRTGVGLSLVEVEAADKVVTHMVQGVRMAADELGREVRGLAWESSLFKPFSAVLFGAGILFLGSLIVSEA